MRDFDLILVGGGLANGLIADRLATTRPELDILIVEGGSRLGGDHTWSYHETDVTPEQDRWLRTIGQSAWSSQEVRFPSYSRSISTGYRTLVSSDLHNHIVSRKSIHISLDSRVQSVDLEAVTLDGGQQIKANCIIDGRGLASMPGMSLGYQKFYGLECELTEPHGLQAPILMDTTIDQMDGYRFMYCLPYTPTLLLIEDTYYSDDAELNDEQIDRRVRSYAASKGWQIASVVRAERGILPVILDGRHETVWSPQDKVPRSGMRAGLFHQTTGYSLPFAVRAADNLAKMPDIRSATVGEHMLAKAQNAWDTQRFFRLLNRFLFVAAQDGERRNIFERFYRLPRPLIERFYASHLKSQDMFRIVFGRPPVSLYKAAAAIPPSAAASRVSRELPISR